MQQHIHTIVKHFFQKETLQEVPEQVLQQFTEEYPYSSVGHWLLAKKIHDTAPEKSGVASAEAVAWFHNPLWLHWTLQDREQVAETLIMPASAPREEPVVAPKEASIPPAEAPQETAAPVLQQATITPEVVTEPVIAETDVKEETEILIPGVSEPISLVDEAPEPAVPAESPVSTKEVSPAQEASPGPAMGPAGEFKPVISESEEPVFEPYHTIDYFASQGIKLMQEELKDKLGQQLKSLTEWLRSMKRIAPVTPEITANAFDETMQQSIQEIAGHSVEGKEVITEAMAEVWVKQGNNQKAIAIYEKLSLLNPAKSPYFAARIDQLKAL
jgi:hypothetical protein